MPGIYDMLASVLGSRAPGEDPYGFLAGALKADPEGAGGFADIAGRSREAGAAAGVVTAPLGALDYFGKTLRGEEPFYDVAGHPLDKAYGAAGTLAGVGMTGGIGSTVARAPGEAVLGAGPIRAYHGSPHDFERFDISKIGTGEGAQAYGHGLYFAENPRVAEEYRQALASWPQTIRELLGRDVSDEAAKRFQYAANDMGHNPRTAASWAQASSPELRGIPTEELAKAVPAYMERERPGRMYEVGIHADPERFLDWNKPLRDQTAAVKTGIERMGMGDYLNTSFKGGQLAPGPGANLSAYVDAGIPGIQYLDAGSRGAGTGSVNRVVFDDKLIEILRKYGFLGPLIAGAATASMPEAARK